MTSVFEDFRWRGLVYDHTEDVPRLLAEEKITLYIGFDPTADSLHIGSLVPLMALARMQRYGHTPIALAGGGTGMVGDPSGRSTERNLLSEEQLEANLAGIRRDMETILDFEARSNPARILNNASWLHPLSMMEFLRDVGKHFTVNYMMAKDSVKSRLEREDGISYTEFSYMLLQAYDFLHLFEAEDCVLQAGGSDQWGNITAGVELIRRKTGKRAHGMVLPLITRSDGSKFGKTAEGAVWLNPQKTSPYRFYQYWLNTDDADVINYLKYFTWLDQPAIFGLQEALFDRPEQREAQRTLAQEVTRMVHGDTAVVKAEKAASVLFGGDLEGLDAADIRDIFADVPSSVIARGALEDGGLPIVDLIVAAGLENGKGAARRAIEGGGIYLNNERVNDTSQVAGLGNTIEGQFLILRKGRKKYHLVKVEG